MEQEQWACKRTMTRTLHRHVTQLRFRLLCYLQLIRWHEEFCHYSSLEVCPFCSYRILSLYLSTFLSHFPTNLSTLSVCMPLCLKWCELQFKVHFRNNTIENKDKNTKARTLCYCSELHDLATLNCNEEILFLLFFPQSGTDKPVCCARKRKRNKLFLSTCLSLAQ
jgi:hypothetical protein